MNARHELTLWLGACRYYLGRQSYAVSMFTEFLRTQWANLDPGTRGQLEHDIEEAFQRDDAYRGLDQDRPWPLGDDCDRAAWETVRQLWGAK